MRYSDCLKFCFAVALTVGITPSVGAAPSDAQYKELRTWTLGSSGLPSGRYGDVNCAWWKGLYPNCKHPGVDYPTSSSIAVKAVGSGVVTGTGGTTGKVCIYHSKKDLTLCYLHMKNIKVKAGDSPKKGATIGYTSNVGASNVHLHFEARKGRKSSATLSYSDSLDPYNAARSVR